ncbi:MAG: carboxypeptidase regulatory-like domain-containing protein [Nitrososphaerota archaeon]
MYKLSFIIKFFLGIIIFSLIFNGIGLCFTSAKNDSLEIDLLIITPQGEKIKLKSINGTIYLEKVVPGTYVVYAYWQNVLVGVKSIAVNRGNVVENIELAIYDLLLKIMDSYNKHPLYNAEVFIKHPNGSIIKMRTTDAIISLSSLPSGLYTIIIEWENYGKKVKVAEVTSELVRLKEAGKLVANVFDVVLTLVDGKARPISGATIKLAGVPATTDVNGKAIFTLVPCESNGTPYNISIEKDGIEIAKASITVSPTRTEFTIIGGLYDLRVQVVGAAGQGLPMATVVVKRAGVEVATLTTDPNGVAVVPQLVASDYDVEVLYKGFSGSASISASDLAAGKVVTISLPPYAEVFGIVLTYWTFLAIVIGIILLIIVLVVLLSEYITWRRRKLGIYLPPPPKKEEK